MQTRKRKQDAKVTERRQRLRTEVAEEARLKHELAWSLVLPWLPRNHQILARSTCRAFNRLSQVSRVRKPEKHVHVLIYRKMHLDGNRARTYAFGLYQNLFEDTPHVNEFDRLYKVSILTSTRLPLHEFEHAKRVTLWFTNAVPSDDIPGWIRELAPLNLTEVGVGSAAVGGINEYNSYTISRGGVEKNVEVHPGTYMYGLSTKNLCKVGWKIFKRLETLYLYHEVLPSYWYTTRLDKIKHTRGPASWSRIVVVNPLIDPYTNIDGKYKDYDKPRYIETIRTHSDAIQLQRLETTIQLQGSTRDWVIAAKAVYRESIEKFFPQSYAAWSEHVITTSERIANSINLEL
jgi:hypothetical protein